MKLTEKQQVAYAALRSRGDWVEPWNIKVPGCCRVGLVLNELVKKGLVESKGRLVGGGYRNVKVYRAKEQPDD